MLHKPECSISATKKLAFEEALLGVKTVLLGGGGGGGGGCTGEGKDPSPKKAGNYHCKVLTSKYV